MQPRPFPPLPLATASLRQTWRRRPKSELEPCVQEEDEQRPPVQVGMEADPLPCWGEALGLQEQLGNAAPTTAAARGHWGAWFQLLLRKLPIRCRRCCCAPSTQRRRSSCRRQPLCSTTPAAAPWPSCGSHGRATRRVAGSAQFFVPLPAARAPPTCWPPRAYRALLP